MTEIIYSSKIRVHPQDQENPFPLHIELIHLGHWVMIRANFDPRWNAPGPLKIRANTDWTVWIHSELNQSLS